MWPGLRTQIWTCCKKAVFTIIGTSMCFEVCHTHGQVSRKLHYCLKKKPPKGCMWSGRRLTQIQATIRPAYLWPEIWWGMSKSSSERGNASMAYRKTNARQCSETEKASFLSIRMMEGSRKLFKTQGSSWRYRWRRLCLEIWKQRSTQIGCGKTASETR